MTDFARSRVASVTGSVCIVVFVALALVAPVHAQSHSPPSDKLTALRLEWHTQLARQQAAQWDAALIAPPRATGAVGSLQDPSAVLKELRPVLTGDYQAVRNALSELDARAKARRAEVQKDWAEVYRQRGEFRHYAEAQQAAYGFDFESGSPPGFKPQLFDGVLLAWAVVAV